ncbi:hypothetical protein FKM82_020138 [Ascaphus truei]
MKSTPRWASGSSQGTIRAPYMSQCPRGSSSSTRRTQSACSNTQRLFSRRVRPWGTGAPLSTIRRGSPPMCMSTTDRTGPS